MAVGKKYFSSETLMQLAVFLSMTRPDLQQLLQNPTGVMQEVPGAYNWTGPYNSYGPTAPIDHINFNPKDAIEQSTNPLSDLLRWQDYGGRNEQVINMAGGFGSENEHDAITSLEVESGYSSDHSSLSPPPSSTASVSPNHDVFQASGHESQTDLSQFGAAGFTPTVEDPELYKLLDSFDEEFQFDYGNLPQSDSEQFPLLAPIKSEPLSPLGYREYGSSCPLKGVDLDSKVGCEEDSSFYYDPNHKDTLERIGLPDNFQDEKLFDPYSIDWSSPTHSTNGTISNPDLSLDNDFDLEPLSSSWADDFNLPLDILMNPAQQLRVEENKAAPQNDSGIPVSGSDILSTFDLSNSRVLVPPTSAAVKSEDLSTARTILVRRNAGTPTKAISVPKGVHSGARAKQERVPKLEFSDGKIIDMPVDEFNVFVEELTEIQAKYARDLRRRGKNKEAARICRKRKLDVIDSLEDEMIAMRAQKQKILDERKQLQAENVVLKNKASELQTYVLQSLRDEQGLPLSPTEYALFQGENGNVFVAKNLNS